MIRMTERNFLCSVYLFRDNQTANLVREDELRKAPDCICARQNLVREVAESAANYQYDIMTTF